MRLACRSAVAVLGAACAAVAQGQPPGPPRPTDLMPSGLQMPAEIIPVSPKVHDRPGASAEWMAIWDDLWKRRDDPAAIKQLDALTEQHLAEDPNGFETTRRQASLVAWEADGEPDGSDEKAAQGKIAWEAGDKAIQANAGDVRRHYFSGVGVGLYSEGVGILTALSQGLEGKFRERLLAALRIDKDFQNGAPQVVWGRYFFKLPWPKRDLDESVKALRLPGRTHPKNWRPNAPAADRLTGTQWAGVAAE